MPFSIHKFETCDRRHNPDWNECEKQCTGPDSHSSRGARNSRFEHSAPKRDSPNAHRVCSLARGLVAATQPADDVANGDEQQQDRKANRDSL